MRRFKDLNCIEQKAAIEKAFIKAIHYIQDENQIFIKLNELKENDCIFEIINEIAKSIAAEAFYPENHDTLIKL